MPPRLRHHREAVLVQQIEGRRAQVFNEDAQALSLPLAEGRVVLGGKGVVVLPGGWLARLQDRAGAIRVVKLEHGRLGNRVRGATAVGLAGVALDLCRASLVGFHQNREHAAAMSHRGRVEIRKARDDLRGRLGVGEGLDLGAPASCQTGKAERGGHQLKEMPAIDPAGNHLHHRLRKPSLHPVAKCRGVGKLVEAPPVGLAAGCHWRCGERWRFLVHR